MYLLQDSKDKAEYLQRLKELAVSVKSDQKGGKSRYNKKASFVLLGNVYVVIVLLLCRFW